MMSKTQQGYEKLDTDVPKGQECGFAARLPQGGESCQADEACHPNFEARGADGGQMAYPPAGYPHAAYEGAPMPGYPVITTPMPMSMPMPMPVTMVGPLGMVVQDPLGMMLGRRGRRHARRMARAMNGQRCRLGPVRAVVGLIQSAMQRKHQNQPPAPARIPGPSYQ